jgi:hypothetical protein
LAALVPAVDECLDRGDEVLTEVKVPRRMACRVVMPKKISTTFSHDPEVGVKCMTIRGFLASQACTFGCLWVP